MYFWSSPLKPSWERFFLTPFLPDGWATGHCEPTVNYLILFQSSGRYLGCSKPIAYVSVCLNLINCSLDRACLLAFIFLSDRIAVFPLIYSWSETVTLPLLKTPGNTNQCPEVKRLYILLAASMQEHWFSYTATCLMMLLLALYRLWFGVVGFLRDNLVP